MPAALTLDATLVRETDAPVVRDRTSLLTHLIDAVRAWYREADERAVGEYIAHHGGRLTHDLERQISRRFGSPV